MHLNIGSHGDDVKNIQRRMSQWGFALDDDGLYGPKTKAAIKEYQMAMGLQIDGIVGTKTYGALSDYIIEVTHFEKEEFRCQCDRYCNGYINVDNTYAGMSLALLILLERIRIEVGRHYGRTIPCRISPTGGYRCHKYNALVGGASRSLHLIGRAADIAFDGVPVSVVNTIAKRLNPYGGIGLNGRTITHVDVRGYHARWYYN